MQSARKIYLRDSTMLKWYFTGALTILATKAAKRANTKSVGSLAVLMIPLSILASFFHLTPSEKVVRYIIPSIRL